MPRLMPVHHAPPHPMRGHAHVWKLPNAAHPGLHPLAGHPGLHPRLPGLHGESYFGTDGDDPIGDGVTDNPASDLGFPETDPWGLEGADLTDEDFDPLLHSGRTGRLEASKFLEGGFGTDVGFEDDYYSGYGVAPLIGHEGVAGYPVRYGSLIGCEGNAALEMGCEEFG